MPSENRSHESTKPEEAFELLVRETPAFKQYAWTRQSMADLLERQKRPRPRNRFFHYTSCKGFSKIIENGRLWITNAAYLNDSEELTYPVRIARGVLEQLCGHRPDGDFWAGIAADLETHVAFKCWYVASFSTRGNQLSQWRSYCPQGGFSIGFSPGLLSKAISRSSQTLFGPVEYSERKQKDRILGTFNAHVRMWKDLLARFPGVEAGELRRTVENSLQLSLAEQFIFFKAPVFREEHEWRAVRFDLEGARSLFRVRGGVLTPYQELDLTNKSGHLPLSKVFVSPRDDSDLAMHSAQLLLNSKGYGHPGRLLSASGYKLRF